MFFFLKKTSRWGRISAGSPSVLQFHLPTPIEKAYLPFLGKTSDCVKKDKEIAERVEEVLWGSKSVFVHNP